MFTTKMGKMSLTLFIISLGAVFLMLSGCSRVKDNQPAAGQPSISPKPTETSATVPLYFSDRQAMYLVPENREILKKDEPLEDIVVRELIKGPGDTALLRTIPPETRLLSLFIVNGVAYVNFSKDIVNRQWGGSTGEGLLIYSVVNSLCEQPGITRVQFLVEGNKMETLFGHIEIMEPLSPNWDLVQGGRVKPGV